MSDSIGKLREFADGPWFTTDGEPILERIGHAKTLLKACADVVEAADQLLVGGCKCLKCQTIRPSVTRLFEAIDREVEA